MVRVEWWSAFGLQYNPSLEWIIEKRMVSEDGVHMTRSCLERIAGALLRRLTEREAGGGWQTSKRMRTDLMS